MNASVVLSQNHRSKCPTLTDALTECRNGPLTKDTTIILNNLVIGQNRKPPIGSVAVFHHNKDVNVWNQTIVHTNASALGHHVICINANITEIDGTEVTTANNVRRNIILGNTKDDRKTGPLSQLLFHLGAPVVLVHGEHIILC